MINHHTILRDELKKILNNINKKYTVLRKEIVKTTEVFENGNIPVFPYEVCFGLFRHLTETASLSSSLSFLPFLQNLINLGFANFEMSRQILTLLTNMKSIPKFQSLQNQTKLQQILILLISKTTINLQKLGFTHSLVNVFMSLQNAKYKILWLKTTAALIQILLLMTNDIRDESSERKISQLNIYLKDFVITIRNQSPQWLIQYTDPFILLQVFSEILDEKYFLENGDSHQEVLAELIEPIRKQIKKLYDITIFSPTKGDSSKGWQLNTENKLLILIRTGCKINRLTKKGFQFIEQIIKMISEKGISNLKIIGYEAFSYLFRDPSWMYTLLQSEYHQLFNFLLTTQFNTIKHIFVEFKERVDLSVYYTWQQNNFNKIIGSNSIDIGMYDFNHSHEVKVIIKNIEEITYGLYSIYGQNYHINLQAKIQQKVPLEKTYKFCQKTIFEIIKAIISREMSEDTLQSILKIAQKFINLSGCFNDSSVSNMYIKLMCKHCLPVQFKNIGHRHVQINKMILNSANCLGNLFTTNCWVTVWKALQNYSIYYNRYLLGKQQLQSARQSDVQILYKSMDSIFTETPKYDNQYLLQILRSLIEVTYECLENNFTDEARKIFAFERIQQIYKLNLHRICIIWPQLSSSLLCITTSKVMYFRVSSLNLLNILIPKSLNYLKNHPETLELSFSLDNYESLILQPWMNLVDCQFPEIKNQLIKAVNKLIIDYGHIMTNGWKCILEIVAKTNDLKSLQTIVETFLEKVPNYIMNVLLIVDSIERKLQDTNQKYLCLTMIWSIADFSSKIQQPEVLRKIYEILLSPSEMFNLGTEARHSSFYIFAQLIVHNCKQKSVEFWKWIFEEVENFYNYGIDLCLQSSNKQFSEEALKNIITNLIKIYKKMFLVSKEWQSDELILKLLDKFYLFCSRILKFRNTQTYQSLIKQIKQILYHKGKESLAFGLKEFYGFLETITSIYYVESDNKMLKCLITYLPNDIFQILTHCFDGLEKHFLIIYKLIEKIYLLRLQALQKQIKLQQLRIFFEERTFYELMKKMNHYIHEERSQLVPLYIENIVKTIHKLKLYEDYLSISKMTPFLTNTQLKYLDINQQMSLQLYKNIVKVRHQENWLKNWSTSKDIPIWYITIQDILKLSYQYLVKQKYEIAQTIFNMLYEILLQKDQQNSKTYFITYNASQECISNYYESELSIFHFLIENYIFNEKVPEPNLSKIQNIVNKISERSQHFDAKDEIKKGQNAYQLLFKICQNRKFKDQRLIQRQSIFIQKLFHRIFTSLDSFNPTQLSQNSLQEIKFSLKKMQYLQLQPRILLKLEDYLSKKYFETVNLNTHVLQLKKAHLFYFQPAFAKCIKASDLELRNIVTEIIQASGTLLLSSLQPSQAEQ